MDINDLNIIHDTANYWELPLPWYLNTPEPLSFEEKNMTFKWITNWDEKDILSFKSHDRLDILEDLKPEISRFHVKKPKKIINGDETILITDSPNVEILKPNYSKNNNSKKNYLAIYIQKIDLYWPLFLYLIIICIGIVLAIKLPTPASTLFNAKHNDNIADERQESQKILIKFSKTKKLWIYFKNIYKKIFKIK